MSESISFPMHVAFRTDASIKIGTGHVMRCLTLADALQAKGADCVFLCRPHDGNLLELISARGHTTRSLPAPEAGTLSTDTHLPYADWLGAHWKRDAKDTRSALGTNPVDWLVVDHYALDAKWQDAMRPAFKKLLVIDDLANRPHVCDILLDQNLGRSAKDYTGLLASDTKMLIGPHYALLRPEFAKLREESLARRATPRLERILITMGGVDKDNATEQVLEALDKASLPVDVKITVIMGSSAPWLDRVRERASHMRRPTRVLFGVSDMARLMTDSDLAIGAAGSTSWERCCLGLPAVQMVTARNQIEISSALKRAGAVFSVIIDTLDHDLKSLFESGQLLDNIRQQSEQARLIGDGGGSNRVTREMRSERP